MENWGKHNWIYYYIYFNFIPIFFLRMTFYDLFFFVHSILLLYRNETVMMTSEEPSTELNFIDNKGSKRPIRPKLLKLTDVQMPNRSRKKNRFKVWWIDIFLFLDTFFYCFSGRYEKGQKCIGNKDVWRYLWWDDIVFCELFTIRITRAFIYPSYLYSRFQIIHISGLHLPIFHSFQVPSLFHED